LKTLDLTVMVTCYNEADSIIEALDCVETVLGKFNYSYEVLIYDDHSTDRSVQVINEFLDQRDLRDRFELITNTTNLGIGVNYFRAAEKGKGTYFFILHGDNAMHADSIWAIMNLLGKADIILPYYNTKLFSKKYNFDHRTFTRRLLSFVFVRLVQLFSGHNLRYFNGLVLHRRENVLKYQSETFGLGYQAELLCKLLNDPKTTFLEVRVHNHDRSTGQTTAFKIKNILSVMGSLIKILKKRAF
jgi:glycosyltransferase involved in cell wall biosynthesis